MKRNSPKMSGKEFNCHGSQNDIWKFHSEETYFSLKNLLVQTRSQSSDNTVENGNIAKVCLVKL